MRDNKKPLVADESNKGYRQIAVCHHPKQYCFAGRSTLLIGRLLWSPWASLLIHSW